MSLSYQSIISTALRALSTRADELDEEQSVRGIDAFNELQIHALLEDAFIEDGFGVVRESHYPSDGDAYTTSSRRQRCDLALISDPKLSLTDPTSELKQLAMAQDTLFAESQSIHPDPTTTCPPEDAWWIEIKSCAQFAYRDGVPTPNPGYAHELVSGLQNDVCKLSADPHIWHAASLITLFCEDETIARHDLNQAASMCMDQDLPIQSPLIETHSITDRGGNGCVAIGLFPLSI